MEGTRALESTRPELSSGLPLVPAVWPWTCHLTSLSLSFLPVKWGYKISCQSGNKEDKEVSLFLAQNRYSQGPWGFEGTS